MQKIREHMRLGLSVAAFASLASFFEACQTSNPSPETLQKLLETNPNISKIEPQEMIQIESLIDLAKEKKLMNLATSENDSLKQSLSVDTVTNRVEFKTEFKNKKIDNVPYRKVVLNKLYEINKKEGWFLFSQISTEKTMTPSISRFGADLKTGVMNVAMEDVVLVPEMPEGNGPESFVIKTDGTIEGNLNAGKKLHFSYVQGLKDIQVLSMNIEK